MLIHVNIFSWLTSLGKLVSQHDGARAKRRGSSGEHCFFFCVLRVKQQGHEVWGGGAGGPGPGLSFVQAAEVRGLLIPWVPTHGAGAGLQWAGRQPACCRRLLFKVSAVAVLCSFVLFVEVFFFNLYSRNVTLWLLFFVCSRAPRCKPRAPSKRCFYILHSIHCFAAACGDAGLLQEVVECLCFTSPSAWHS